MNQNMNEEQIEKPHLLFIFPHFRTPKDLGGLRSYHIGKAFSEKNYQVTVLAPGVDTMTGQRHSGLGWKLWHTEFVDGVKVIRTNSTNNNRSNKLSRLLFYLTLALSQLITALFIRNITLVNTTSLPLTFMLVGYLKSMISNTQLVIEARDIGIDAAIEVAYLRQNPMTRFIRYLESALYKRADHVIVVSDGFKRILVDKGVNANNISVVFLGYDDLAGANTLFDIRVKYGLEQKTIVLYAGNLGHIFNIPLIIDSARILKNNTDIVFVFVGGGQRLPEYMLVSEKEALNCVFTGPRPKSEISSFCSQADICVYPANNGDVINAMLGNKIFDYLGNGTQTIFSGPTSDVCKLIHSVDGGACVSADSQQLANAIIKLTSDLDLCSKRGLAAGQKIRSSFSVPMQMDKFEIVIRDVLNRQQGANLKVV